MDIVQLKRMEPIFGTWRVDKEIGSGSFGKVYAIYKDDGGFRFKAALKVITIPSNNNDILELDAQGFDHAAKVRYFDNITQGIMDEIRIMNTLRGFTNIVCFEDYQLIPHEDHIGRDILIRMELLERLDDHMQKIRATQYDVVVMLRDIAQALVLCDKKNIIHRDIKPDNVMVSESGDYKLVDFGIARNMERTNQASTKAGSYPYMAPEVQMHVPYGKVVDIYSLGVLAYRELNAYRYPFLPPYPQPFTAEERDQALYRRFRGEKIPPIQGVPKQLMAIVEKCIAHKPEHRYPNAQALLNDLNAVINLPELKKKRLFDDGGNMLPVYSSKDFNPQSFKEGSQKVPASPSRIAPGTGTGTGTGSYGGSSRIVSEKEKKGKKKRGALIAVLAVLLLAAAGAAAFFVLQPKEDVKKNHAVITASVSVDGGGAEHTEPNRIGAGSGAVRITGQAEPDTLLTVSYGQTSQEVRTDETGAFSVEVQPDQMPENQFSEVQVAYSEPAEADRPSQVSVYRDTECALAIDESRSGADTIAGTTEAWALVYGIYGDETPVQANENGAFAVSGLSLQDGSTVTLRAVDPYGNQSAEQTFRVPYRLTIECSGKNQTITGKTEEITLYGEGPEGQEILVRAVTDSNITVHYGTVSIANGRWEITGVNVGNLQGEGTLRLTAEWAGDGEHAAQTAAGEVRYDRTCNLTFDAPEGNILSEDTKTLTGMTDAGAHVQLYSQDGSTLGDADANEYGRFEMTGLNLTAQDLPYGMATDTAGNRSAAFLLQTVQPGARSQAQAAEDAKLQPIDLTLEGAYGNECWTEHSVILTGTAQTGIELEALVGQQSVASFFAEGDGETGSYRQEISLENVTGTQEQKLEIRVKYKDRGGPEAKQQLLYDAGVGAPAPESDNIMESASVLRGTADAGDTVVLGININGALNEKQKTTAGGDGTFEIRLDEPLEVGGDYALVAFDWKQPDGRQMSSMVSITVTQTVRENLNAFVSTNGKALFSGDRIARSGFAAVPTEGELEYGTVLVVRGTVSGAEVRKPLPVSGATVDEKELAAFEDGETLNVIIHYEDLNETRSSFSMNLTLDASTMQPQLKGRSLTSEMTTIEGTAEPGSTVTLRIKKEKWTATADLNGDFRFDGLTLSAGNRCELQAEDSVGNVSEALVCMVREISSVTVDRTNTEIDSGWVNGTVETLELSGTAEPEKELELLLNGTLQTQGLTFTAEGNWSVSVAASALKPNEENTLEIRYAGQADSGEAFSFVYDPSCAAPVLSADVTEDTEKIRGTSEANATVELRTADGSLIDSAKCKQDGAFTIQLPSGHRNKDEVLVLKAQDEAGNTAETSLTVSASKRTQIQMNARDLPEEEGQYLVKYGMKAVILEGTGYADLRLTITVTDEGTGAQTSAEVICGGDGRWQKDAKLPDSWTTAQVTAAYSDGKYSELSASLRIRYDEGCELTCDTANLLDSMTFLDVRTEDGAEVAAVLNDTQNLQTETLEGGVVRIHLPALKEGDSVKVRATDRAGNTQSLERDVIPEPRDPVTVTLNAPGATVNRDMTELRFSGQAQAERPVRLTVAGKSYDVDPAADGSWEKTVSVQELNLKEGKVSYEAGYADRKPEAEGTFTYDISVLLEADGGNTLNEDDKTVSGRAEKGATVWLYVNGTAYPANGITVTDGTFRITDYPALNTTDTVKLTAMDAAGNSAELPFTVTPANRAKITLTSPKLTDGQRVKAGTVGFAGTAEAGKNVRITVTHNGKKTEMTAAPDSSGKWSYARQMSVADGETYTVSFEYEDGKSAGSAGSLKFTADGTCSLTNMPAKLTDADTSFSGQTDPDATVTVRVNGKDPGAKVETASSGRFTVSGLALECDDSVTVYAQDALGNRSTTVAITVDTAKERLWYEVTEPGDNKTTAQYVFTRAMLFSHEPLEVYYTLTQKGGNGSATVQITGNDLQENTNREKAQEAARKIRADLPDTVSVRYSYDVSYRQDILGNSALPNGEYTYRLTAKGKNSGTETVLCERTVRLADPAKEPVKTVKDYSHEYSDPAFAGGLDELRAEAFPRNRVVLSGWIWGSEDQLKDFQIVVYKIKDKKKPTEKDKRDNMFSALTAQTIAEDGGSEVLTYRNVAAEHPELAGRFGEPNLEKAGFALELNLDGYGQFKSGTTYRLEICLRDNTGRAEDDLRIGVYEITIQDGAAGAGVSAEEIAAGWDNRTGE